MRKLVGVLGVAVLVLVGCGGDDDDAATDDPVVDVEETDDTEPADDADDDNTDDAGTDDTSPCDVTESCALLTPEQIGEVLGTEVSEGTDMVGSCEYPSTDGTTNVSVELIDQQRYEEREAEGGVEPVTGVGAAAFSDTTTGFLYVDAAGTWFRVNVTGGDRTADEVLELNRGLAELVIESL